jgi:hypothetical protein
MLLVLKFFIEYFIGFFNDSEVEVEADDGEDEYNDIESS